jgi:hypothetical protein
MSTEKCDQEVFDRGKSMGLFAMSKQEAEDYCAAETKRTGYKHDWHYIAGRVHVLALIEDKPAEEEAVKTESEVVGSWS